METTETKKVRYTLRVWTAKKLQSTKRVLINFNRDLGAIERKVRSMLVNTGTSSEPKMFTLERTVYAGNLDDIDETMIQDIMQELKTGQQEFLENKDDSQNQHDEEDTNY